MDAYQYLCDDKSLTYPPLKKYLWAPMMRFIPLRRSANSITLWGNLCSAVAFAFLALTPLTGAPSAAFVLPAIAIFLYLSLDNIDGAQARRTGSSSPLGEFLDHWCDAFNAGFLVLGFAMATGLPAWMMLLVLALSGLAYLATMWEQRVTGWLQFGPISTIEGILLVCMMYVLVAIFGLDAIAREPILGSLTGSHIFYIIACAGFAQTTLASVMRVCGWAPSRAAEEGRTWTPSLRDFVPFVVLLGLGTAWFVLGQVSVAPIAFFFVFSSCLVGGRQIIARVRGKAVSGFDALVVAGAIAGVLFAVAGASALAQNVLAWLLVAGLGVRLFFDFHTTTRALAEYLRPHELLGVYYLRRR